MTSNDQSSERASDLDEVLAFFVDGRLVGPTQHDLNHMAGYTRDPSVGGRVMNTAQLRAELARRGYTNPEHQEWTYDLPSNRRIETRFIKGRRTADGRLIPVEASWNRHRSRRFWWVNQNQTHREEVAGGFMWSPKRKANGDRNQFYDNMVEAKPADVVFSYYDTRVQCIGIVTTAADTVPKPEFGPEGQSNDWSNEGWLVGVEYTALDSPFRPKDHIEQIRPLLPNEYSPLLANGNGLQSVYLAEISEGLAGVLAGLARTEFPDLPPPTDPEVPEEDADEEEQELANLQGRTDIGDVERTQLVKARRGQGIFRNNVRINESQCRVTGVTDLAHLRASHIKPWRDCSDVEKVHGCNGLLLSPHVDHLFDRGWISFTDDGDLMVSEVLSQGLLDAWGIPSELNVGLFSEKQAEFLAYHRSHVFRTESALS